MTALDRYWRSLFPTGECWTTREGGAFARLQGAFSHCDQAPLEDLFALGALEDPFKTPYLERLEEEYGLASPPCGTSQHQRELMLKATISLARGGSLQQALHLAGFTDLYIYDERAELDLEAYRNVILVTSSPHFFGEGLPLRALLTRKHAGYLRLDELSARCGHPEAYCGIRDNEKSPCYFFISGRDTGISALFLGLGDLAAELGHPEAYCGNYTSRFQKVAYDSASLRRIITLVERARPLFAVGILDISEENPSQDLPGKTGKASEASTVSRQPHKTTQHKELNHAELQD